MTLVILEPGESRVLVNHGQKMVYVRVPAEVKEAYRREFDLNHPPHHADDEPAGDEMELEDRVAAAHMTA